MTLPFRRRHHDDESAHDRARALTSREMLEPLDPAEASWLAGHLDDCAECRQDREAYLADRELLRSLRDTTPVPPRDLWARTSAALDREARNRPARAGGARARDTSGRRAWRGFPIAPAAAFLVVLVVIGASIVPRSIHPQPGPGDTQAAAASVGAQPTEIAITAGKVGWVHPTANGSWELVLSNVDAVCPRTQSGCESLGGDVHGRPLALGNAPTSMTISPDENQLVVESTGDGPTPNRILVVPVTSSSPDVTPEPTSVTPSTETATAPPTVPASPVPSSDIAAGVIEIASGVTVVGETAYAKNGDWLAFSARPADGSTGPDLYLWHVGDPAALPVTSDHQTYFSAWLGNQVLASSVAVPDAPAASNGPSASDANATGAPSQSAIAEAHPSSFLLDPETHVRTDIALPDVWLPVVDPTGRFVSYWSGTLRADDNGREWRLGTGRLVLDGWSSGVVAQPSDGAGSSQAPSATASPVGPSGSPVAIVTGETAAFTSKFDPTGTRLAVWVADQGDATVGSLYLRVLDPATGAVNASIAPLDGVLALRRFSIDTGRLAWVSPPGQDGQESSVQVLGWSRDDFGEIRTIPSKDLYIVR
jgi:hypothetical protein